MQLKKTFHLVIALALPIALIPLSQAEVYKQIDEQGNITYTDVPTKAKEKPIKVDPMTTFSVPAPKTKSAASEAEKKPEKTTYRSLTIQAPTNNEVIRANNGAVSVTLQSQPGLDTAAGHKYSILLDGQVLQSGESASLTINNVARGNHSISAQIVDAKGQALMSATPVTVQVLRASALSPARKN